MVTKADIYRKALLSLNIRYNDIIRKYDRYNELKEKVEAENSTATSEEIAEYNGMKDAPPEKPIEVEYCEEYIDSATAFCATIRPWFWLLKQEEYTDSDIDDDYTEFNGGTYAYSAPSDMLYPYLVNGVYNKDFKMGFDGMIHTTEPLETLEYITSVTQFDGEPKQKWKYPSVYANLIACRLALEIAPYLAPDAVVEQRISSQLQLNLQTLNKIDIENWRSRNKDPKEFVE